MIRSEKCFTTFLFAVVLHIGPSSGLLFSATAQNGAPSTSSRNTISGTVTGRSDGEVLIGAHVFIPETGSGTTTNEYGFYSLTVSSVDSLTIVFSYTGYEPLFLKLGAQSDRVVNVALDEQSGRLNEIVIEAVRSDNRNIDVTRTGHIDVPIREVESLPAILGEQDVLKVLQLLPGVQPGNEGTTGIHVRGGGVDQNLVLLDGATVYNPNHLFGLFSTFNTHALNNVELVKGGFPAYYGGRLSSVVEISLREGNSKRYAGQAGIGLISSRGTVEGPLHRDRGSFILSGRRSYADLVARPFLNENNRRIYYFYDVNSKINYRIGGRDRIFFSLFRGRDRAEYVSTSGLGYKLSFGNSTATLRWAHILGSRLFSNASIVRNEYFLDVATIQGQFFSQNFSRIRDFTGRLDVQFFPGRGHTVRFGAEVRDQLFESTGDEGDVLGDLTIPDLNRQTIIPATASHVVVYLNDRWEFGSRAGINLGLRVPHFRADEARYTRVEPRASIRVGLDAQTSLKASWTVMNQFVHLIPSTTASLPTDIWVPSSDRTRPQRSSQLSGGIFRNFLNNAWETSLELYTKTMRNQVLFREGTQLFTYTNIDDELTYGKGWSYGGELFIRRGRGQTTGWLSYTLSWTKQRFSELNFGRTFPFRYDRRHNLTLAGRHELNDRWSLAGTFVFLSGARYTLPTGRLFSAQGGDLYAGLFYDYERLNNYTLRPTHRLDVSATYRLRPQHVRRSELIFGLYNVYSRPNPYYVYLDLDLNTGEPVGKEVAILPVVPSISYNIWF